MAGRPRLDVGTFGTITVHQLDRDRYRAETRYRDNDGRVRKVGALGTSRNDATAALKRKLLDRRDFGDEEGLVRPSTTFKELAELWITSVREDAELTDSTKHTYEWEMRHRVLPDFAAFTVREVSTARVERFIKAQRAKSYSRAAQCRRILSLSLGLAVRHGALPANPVAAIPRLRKPPAPPKALTMEEVAQLREAGRVWRTEPGRMGPKPDGQIQDLIEVMLGSAIRIGEALALRKCDIDLAASPPTLSVNGTVVMFSGRRATRQAQPKSLESRRTIAIPPFCAAVLARRLALIEHEDDEWLVFSTRVGTPHSPYNMRRQFRELLKLAGLEGRDIVPHSLRKTGATLLSTHANDQVASTALGHTDTRTTRRHYVERSKQVDPTTATVLERLAPLPSKNTDESRS